MTVSEARAILREYYENTNPSEDDRFVYTEALQFLIRETKNPAYMMELGGMYYEEKDFDLARKYYEQAAEYNSEDAFLCLGYIWYYGRTGEKDFGKAFYYYDKARQAGSVQAAYKVADMYKNGYFVEKSYGKYKEIIEELYPKVQNARRLNEPMPEIYTRLAGIRAAEGKIEEALELYDEARDFLAQRIQVNPFFGDLTIMKYLIADVYRLRKSRPAEDDLNETWPDEDDLYDLYEILKKPVKVEFLYEKSYGKGEMHEVEAVQEEDGLVIRFDDKWYRNIDDFFKKAELDGEKLTTIYDQLYDIHMKD